jgi:uncharacterized protein (DUF2236 family)
MGSTALGYFSDDSMVRQVHRELVVALAGPRALLMQAALPEAFEALFAHSSSIDDPYERLARTAEVMNAIVFGTKAEADRLTRRVRAMHRRAGVDRPDWLLWVLSTLVDSSLVVYDRYVATLSRDDRDRYWQEYKQVGRLFALEDEDMPATIEDFDAYLADMLASDTVDIGAEAREVAVRIVMRPPVPVHLRPLLELANFITVGLLPKRIRAEYGFGWDPARGLAVSGGAQYLKRVVVPLLPRRLRIAPGARAAA